MDPHSPPTTSVGLVHGRSNLLSRGGAKTRNTVTWAAVILLQTHDINSTIESFGRRAYTINASTSVNRKAYIYPVSGQ